MRSAADWLASLSPWPREFRLDRMHALLGELGDPHRAYPSVHVVGTNGKTTATRTIEALLRTEGLRVGSTVSPHVRSWSERIRVDGREADFERAIARVRPLVDRLGATQFEAVTAAAFAEFAYAGVDAAAVEAGLGGRLDATNVIDAPVVLLTNVDLEHTAVLGSTREEIAREKLAVVVAGSTAVLPDDEFAHVVPHARIEIGGAREAASAFLGRPVTRAVDVRVPGRLEHRRDDPVEVWDGAHNPAGARWLVERLPRADYVLVSSILSDKDARAMLEPLASVARRAIFTASSHPRARDPAELAALAEPLFASAVAVAHPYAALEHARGEARAADGAVLVAGSLYLLGDLAIEEERRACRTLVSG